MDDENGQTERGHAETVHLRPVTIETRDNVQHRVDHERVEQRNPGELDQQLVDGGTKRWSSQEDECDGNRRQEQVDQGPRGRDHDLLCITEIAWIEGDVACKPIETPVEDLSS